MQISDIILSNPTIFRRAMSLYPPFVGAGIRVARVSHDFREVDVELRLGRFNRNAFGTHFGGSLYSMTDPFFALMYVANLGPRYSVWDARAHVEFKRPGTGVVQARFRLSQPAIETARRETRGGGKFLPRHTVEIRNGRHELIARVEKELYIRRKPLNPERVRRLPPAVPDDRTAGGRNAVRPGGAAADATAPQDP